MKASYDVVIIGSGFGGSIPAMRIARAQQAAGKPVSVCVLEKGKRYRLFFNNDSGDIHPLHLHRHTFEVL